jgi:hypothetical protein
MPRTDLDCDRGEWGQRDRGQAHEQEAEMRWNRTTVQPFLDVRAGALNDTLEDAFRGRYPGFRPTDDDGQSQKGQPPGLHAFLM